MELILFILVITLFALLFIRIITLIAGKFKKKPPTPKEIRAEILMETLEWMYIAGILSTEEYNDLMIRSLPHTK